MATVSLTEADTDKTRAVQVGDSVELRLPENPTTGYRWSIDISPAGAATLTASRWNPGGPGIGAAGTREFVIAVRERGAVRMHAKLWREWQGEGSAIERRDFNLQAP